MASPPELIIRLGSHAEKEYVLKLARFLDGVIVGANLFEVTPGATASLLLTVGRQDTSLYVDPMTYAYGAYVDPATNTLRMDLDWIKSDQIHKDKKGRKKEVRNLKRSYTKLAVSIGAPLDQAVKNSKALTSDVLDKEGARVSFCTSVADYQLNRIAQEFKKDEELKHFLKDLPKPSVVFAPYFYVEPTHPDEWIALNLKLMTTTAKLKLDVPIHGILCANVALLENNAAIDRLAQGLPETGIDGVWLWFSSFFEELADRSVLRAYRDLVKSLAKKLEVRARHGGFFSLALSKSGMCGISHGVGYGEQKDVVPVIGQSIPTVRYYLPPLARRLGVPEIERAFDALGIGTPSDFHEKVCACAVCKAVVRDSLDEFSSFGDMHFSRPMAKRRSQTPAAAKRCRFHFLLSRIRERDDVRTMTTEKIVARLEKAANTWGGQPSLRGAQDHVRKWIDVLSEKS